MSAPQSAALAVPPSAFALACQQALSRFTETLEPEERQLRLTRLQDFVQTGWPTKAQERWRYTDLSALANAHFEVPALTAVEQDLPAANDAANNAADAALTRLPKSDGLVYRNGVLDTALSSATELSGPVSTQHEPVGEADPSIAALNAAFAMDGLTLQLGANSRIARPFHLVLAAGGSDTPVMVHQRHTIELGENAEATVVMDCRGLGEAGAAAHLSTQWVEIRLAAGARLKLYRLQHDRPQGSLLTRIDARIARDARLDAICIDSGQGFCRHDFNVELAGPGAEVDISGLYHPAPLSSGRAHLDNHTLIIHAQAHGRSRENFRGIVDERSRAIFNGKVVVAKDAQKTDSEQRVATLLLSRRAEANAKPELEIHADDVRCAHGATVGQLDATALAYLRSRGIDPQTARALLLQAFATQILDLVSLPSLRALLNQRLNLPGDEFAGAFDAA